MANKVSIPVSIDLKANAASMKELYRDISDLIANIDPGSALAKNIAKVMGRLKDQVTDFELISNKSFIQQSDVNSALSIFKRFYRDIGRMNEDIQGAGFNSFIHEDSVINSLQTIQDELDKVQDAAEKIKTVNISDAFKIEGKDQKSIKDLQKKFSLDTDDSASLVEARSAAITNLTSKTEEYNKALERQKELQESQKKIQDKITQRSNAYNTYFGTSEQRKKFAFNQMYESIASMKGNWSIDTYEKSFNDIVATFFETTKSGKVKFTNFGQDRLNNLASLLGIDLSTVKQDAATLQQEILKAISNLNFADVRRAIGSGKKEFSAVGDDYKLAKQAWADYNGFAAKDRIELDNQLKASDAELNNLSAQIPLLKGLMDEADSLQNQIDELYNAVFGNLDKEAREQRRNFQQQMKDIKEASTIPIKQGAQGVTDRAQQKASELGEQNEVNLAAQRAQAEADAFKANLKASIKHWMGAQQIITYIKQGIRQAYQDIQGLDKAMTDIAVVTDFSVSDLWGKINEYMSIAQQYGVTTQGVYKVSQLYFQQGLGEADTMQLTTETLKMARIAGMEYKDAADGMTVALRGFKMEMEDAARVTDVYSKVAAVTASDSQELIEAMSKTASSAASVGSGFEETTAMLAVMIEATREAPTNIGSAMKSIISRYGEMTKGMTVDTDGEEIAFNKVDTALQSVGVSIKDATGQFREFDDVIYELAGKWETLDSLSQRYVATVFAGNRQQSRFLALMSNYDRLVEITEDAQNSEDAGLLQYSKTLDSLETKLNNVKTSFQQFYMDIFDGEFVKGAVDDINEILKGFNKLGKISTTINLASLIIGAKALANAFIDSFVGKFVSGFSEITSAGKNSAEQIRNSFLNSINQINAGFRTIQEWRDKNFIGPRRSLSQGITQIVTAAPTQTIMNAAGTGLTLLGTNIASRNQGLGGAVSSIGSGLNIATSISSTLVALKGTSGFLGTIGAAAGPIGLAAGALTALIGIISTIPSAAEKAQQEAEKAAKKAEESNIKRAKAQERVRGLEDGIEDLEELGKKRFYSDEDMQAWLDANNALFEKFPELAVKFDEAGNSIVDLASAEAELTAAREAASNAARQAAADEYDKAKAELKAAKSEDIDVLQQESTLKNKIQQEIKKVNRGGFSEIFDTSTFENDQWLRSLRELEGNDFFIELFSKIQKNKNLQEGLDSYSAMEKLGYSREEAEKVFQNVGKYNAKLDAAERLEGASRDNRIAAEVTSILNQDYLDNNLDELEGAYEAIQAAVIESTSKGELDFSDIRKRTEDIAILFSDFQNNLLYDEDKFKEIFNKAETGKITESAFSKALKGLGATDELIQYYIDYLQSTFILTSEDFIESLKAERKGNYNALQFVNQNLSNQNRKDIINNEVEFWESQIEANKIDSDLVLEYINEYARILASFGTDQTLIDIFTSGDLTNLEGIQTVEKALQDAGWDGELNWSTLIPPSVINFTTSYENLMDKTVTSLEEMSETFDTAAGEMDIKDAQEVAKKLGKDVSIFDQTYFTREGETFLATQEAINLLKEEQAASVQKEADKYLEAITAARTDIKNLDTRDELLNKYGDTVAAAVTWAKENIKDFDQKATPETMEVGQLQEVINQYYTALEGNIIAGSKEYITYLNTQLQASSELQNKAFRAKKNLIEEALPDNLNIAEGLQESAYSLLGKLSQDITTTLDETEYALFNEIFKDKEGKGLAEKYLVADGAGGWKFDVTKINEFVNTYGDNFGLFVHDLIYNSAISAEEEIESFLSNAASLGEEKGKGKIVNENDLRTLFEPLIGTLDEGIWIELLGYFLSNNLDGFLSYLKESGVELDDKSKAAVGAGFTEYWSGASRGVDEAFQDLLDAKYDYISGKLSRADIVNLAAGTEEEKAYKEKLVEFSNKIGNWASLTLEQQYAALDEVLASDTNLTDKERFENRESERKRLLEESQGQTLVDFGKRRDEMYDLIAETGGKGLTAEEVASLESLYGEFTKVATLDGWDVVLPQNNQRVQDAMAKYRDTLAENAAQGAESLLSAMAEGTLTAAEIQDYFKKLDINITYQKAEELANGTVDSLFAEIKSQLDKADIVIDTSKLQELAALILDSILSSISTGISSLGSGLEGTLSAADYQSLAKKYDLTGIGTTRSSKGIRLGAADQQKLISKMFLEAQNAGLSAEFGDQLWEVWRDSTEDAFEGYIDIEGAIKAANDQIKELGGETADAAQEAVAYRNALQQARHAAMFDEDSVEFAFMEQDATDGLTKNFDKFVDNIDKVKSAFSSFQSGEAIGYQDFYNMMDFIGNSEAGFAKFSEMTGIAASDYQAFVNSVVANTDKWGKVDIGGVAAEMGISVDAAMKGMSEGMTESLKEVAKQQIKYLTGVEQMLEAMLILEGIGSIDLNMSFNFRGDEYQLKDVYDLWSKLDENSRKELEVVLKTALEGQGEGGKMIIDAIWGDGDGMDFLEAGLLDFFGTKASEGWLDTTAGKTFMESLGGLTEGLALDMATILANKDYLKFFNFDKDGKAIGFKQGMVESFFEAYFRDLTGIDFNSLKENASVELATLLGQEGPIKVDLGKGAGIELTSVGADGKITFSGDADLSDSTVQEAIQKQLESSLGREGIELSFENGEIMVTDWGSKITASAEQINTDFQTAAEAASTLQTAITQISSVASTFQAGSGFQSLADQLNAAADAAERLASALGIKVETPQMPEMPFGTGEGQFNGIDYLSSQDILGLGMGPLSPKGLNAQLNQMFATQFAGDAALQIPAKIVGEGGADITDALKTNLLSKSAIPVPGKLDLNGGVKGAGKETDKVEIEAEVNTESVDEQLTTLKTSMDTVNETPVQVDTIDNDTTQAVTELLNAAYEAAVLVEESDPETAVTETGSTFVKEQLDAVAQAANSIPTSINIPVSVSGVAKALGNIALLKLADGFWTGNMNDIGGSALANGNIDESTHKLIAGANIANKTLVGELGPELMVYNNQYHLIGQNGAEFVDVPKDAIVFNHLQTKGIFNGQMGIRGKAMAAGNVTGPAAASGIAGALAAVRRAKSVWQGLLNSLSAADLMGAGDGGGGGNDNNLKAHIEDLQEWYNLSRQIAKIEQEINTLLAKRKNITDGHEYLKNLRETQKLLTQQVATQQVLVKYQQQQLEAQAEHINNNKIWSQFLTVGEDGLLQYKEGNETNGGKGSLSVLQQMNEMSGEEQVDFLAKLGYSYTDNDGNNLEGEELVAKFFEELQKQIDDYDALADTVAEAEKALADLESEIVEIEKEIRNNEIDLSKQIYDIIVDAWEENIKNLKEQNDLIKEANEAYADGIQEAIDAERQMYEQNQAISDREQLQRQLALLRRSGGSASEIADLEAQLDDMLKDEYFANQEEALETIRDANERQVELMDQQVKIQEEQLEYQKENGIIWMKVYEIMEGTDAEILDFMQGNSTTFFQQSTLQQEDMLTEWAKKIGIYTEERQRYNYNKEIDANDFTNSLVSEDGKTDYTSTYNKLKDTEKDTLKSLFEKTYTNARLDGKSEAEALKLANEAVQKFLKDWKKAWDAASKQSSNSGSSGIGSSSNVNSSSDSSDSSSKKTNYHYIKVGDDFIGVNSNGSKSSIISYIAKKSGKSEEEVKKQLKTIKHYTTGGLINYTGPAWVDGSKSKPERILSAEQNKILEDGLAMAAGRGETLKETFSSFASSLGSSIREAVSNITKNTDNSNFTIASGAVQLQIAQLNDKYDVDELFNDVTDKIYSIAARASGRSVSRR